MRCIDLRFRTKEVEDKFKKFFYGEKRCVRIAVFSILGGLMYSQFAFTQDFGNILQMVLDFLFGAWFILFGILCLFPCLLRRIWLLEACIILSNVIVTTRTGATDIYLESTRLQYHSPLKYGLFTFEIAFTLMTLPRLVVMIPCCIINSIFFTIYANILDGKKGISLYIFTTMSYYVNEFFLFILVRIITRTTREMFLQYERVLEKSRVLKYQTKRTKRLLENVLPKSFHDSIINGELDRRNQCIIRTVNDGVVLEADLCNFTQFSTQCDCSRLTKILDLQFSYFDVLSVKLGLVKSKSCGDSFEVYGILQQYNHNEQSNSLDKDEENSHIVSYNSEFDNFEGLSSICLLGIGIVESVGRINELENISLAVRVGICRGDFIICAMGSLKRRISFDIFGETFRRCEKLEKSTYPNTIHVDHEIYHPNQINFKMEKFCGEIVCNTEEEEEEEEDTEETFMIDMRSSNFENVILEHEYIDKLNEILSGCQQEFHPQREVEKNEKNDEKQESLGVKLYSTSKKQRFLLRLGNGEDMSSDELDDSSGGSDHDSISVGGINIDMEEVEDIPKKNLCHFCCSFLKGLIYCIFFPISFCCTCCRVVSCHCFHCLCLSREDYLCYPFCIFLNCCDEFRSHVLLQNRTKHPRRHYHIRFLIIHFLLIIYFLTTDKIEELRVGTSLNPFVMLLYVNIFVNIASISSNVITVCYFPFWSYIFFTILNLLFFKLEFIALIFSNNRTIQYDLMCYLYCIGIVFIVLESGLHSHIRIFLIFVDSFIQLFAVAYTLESMGNMDISINFVQIGIITFIAMIVITYLKELNIRKAYAKQKKVRKSNRQIQIEREKAEALIYSVLPKNIVSQIYELDFRGFSYTFDNSFVCFLNLDLSSTLNHETLLNFISGLFLDFDDFVEEYGCLTIKRVREGYLFISRDHTIDDSAEILDDILLILDLCREVYKKKKDSSRISGNINISLKIGLSHGTLQCGVIGTVRFLFDIFGAHVNLAARLCSTSEDCRIAVCDKNVESIVIDEDSFVYLESRGDIFVKGKGMISSSYIERKNE